MKRKERKKAANNFVDKKVSKLLKIPGMTVEVYIELAQRENNSVKAIMEKVLIDYAKTAL